MSQFIALFFFTLITSTLFVTQAEAKRFGGGQSFGYQRQNIGQQAVPKAPPVQSPAAPASSPPVAGNRWLGPLAGLAAGGLLASLFMGQGFEGIKFLDIVLLLGLVCLLLGGLDILAPTAFQQLISGIWQVVLGIFGIH